MRYRTCTLATLAAVLTIGCAEGDAGAPTAALRSGGASALTSEGATQLSVMSRNLYIGADLDGVVMALASPSKTDDLPALLGAIADLQATAWPVRVVAIGEEIARHRPHVIGLQEVWTVDINLTGLGIPVDIDLDYLTSLQAELASHGLNYVVAAEITGVTAQPFPGISVVDRDVILVDASRVTFDPTSVVAKTFAANVGTVAPGVLLRRGWVSIAATVDGVPMTIASTHLESGISTGLPQLRAYQATELVASLGSATPAVLMGDLNDGPTSAMHDAVVGGGFHDAWGEMRPGVVGLTCCHAPVLWNANAREEFDQRIDYVFSRGMGHQNGRTLGQVRLLGATPGERVQGPSTLLWPSDHAGILVEFLIPPSR